MLQEADTVQLLRENVVEVELASTPATLRAILHAPIAKVDIRCNSAIVRIIARNVASCVQSLSSLTRFGRTLQIGLKK